MEDFGLDLSGGGGPVAYCLSVLEDNGPEDTVAAVGAVNVVGMDGQMAALVTNQVFIVRREEVNASAPESPCATAFVEEEDEFLPAQLNQFRSKGIYSFPAVADVEATPPHEVFQGSGAVAAEVGSGELGQGFFFADWVDLWQFVGSNGIAVLHRK